MNGWRKAPPTYERDKESVYNPPDEGDEVRQAIFRKPKRSRRPSLLRIFLVPMGCVNRLSLLLLLVLLLAGVIGGYAIYNEGKLDLFGLFKPDYTALQFNPDFTIVQIGGGTQWHIIYDQAGSSVFSGLVRYIAANRGLDFPILSHDVLVTSGDYSDPAVVAVSVVDHHLSWNTQTVTIPKGNINLLVIIPANTGIYDQLQAVHNGQQVKIVGRKIYKIDTFESDGTKGGTWQDSGSSTILVTEVALP